jgi:hypothetical protein
MATYDPAKDPPEPSSQDLTALRDWLTKKYIQKRWYLDPNVAPDAHAHAQANAEQHHSEHAARRGSGSVPHLKMNGAHGQHAAAVKPSHHEVWSLRVPRRPP